MGLVRSNDDALALGALALLAGALALAAHWSEPFPFPQASIDFAGIAEPAVGAEHAGPVPPLPVHAAGALGCVQPVPGLRAFRAVDWPSIVRTPLDGLVLTLEDPAGSRIAWELEVQAVAGSLGARGRPYLLGVVEDTSRGLTERVAAAELLRVLDPMAECAGAAASDGFRLADETLQALRLAASALRPFPLRCCAACRSLAAFGTADDLDGFLQTLVAPEDPASRDLAMWGLQAARGEQVALELTKLTCSSADPAAAEAAMIALDGCLRSRRRDELTPDLRDELARRVAALVIDADSPPTLRLRSLPLLCGLGGEPARTALQRVLRDPNTSAALAGAAANALLDRTGERALADPAELLDDGAALDAHPLEMAEAIVHATRAAGLDDELRSRARTCLSAIVERPASSAERSRAIRALASLDETLALQ